jgi:hypothetical protein
LHHYCIFTYDISNALKLLLGGLELLGTLVKVLVLELGVVVKEEEFLFVVVGFIGLIIDICE